MLKNINYLVWQDKQLIDENLYYIVLLYIYPRIIFYGHNSGQLYLTQKFFTRRANVLEVRNCN